MTRRRRGPASRRWLRSPVLATVLTMIAMAVVLPAARRAHAEGPPYSCAASVRTGSGDQVWGVVDQAGPLDAAGRLLLAGWAVDITERAAPLRLEATVRSGGATSVHVLGSADLVRQDVAAVYPWAGAAHGFRSAVSLPEGVQSSVELAAVLPRGGRSTLLTCAVNAPRWSPIGFVDLVDSFAPGAVLVRGWALDASGPTPNVALSVDGGRPSGSGPADLPRHDVEQAIVGAGPRTGFETVVTGVGAGPHTVCAIALNAGPAAPDRVLGCRAVTVAKSAPGAVQGVVDLVEVRPGDPGGRPGAVRVRGWAVDPDAPTLPVLMGVGAPDGERRTLGPAIDPRPDVAERVVDAGVTHGFDFVFDVPEPYAGLICVYAGELSQPGLNVVLGCGRPAPLAVTAPVGLLETLASPGPGQLRIAGWAAEGSTFSPLTMRIRTARPVGLDPEVRLIGPASIPRPDLPAWVSGSGSAHGFSELVGGLTSGVRVVCVDAIGSGSAAGLVTVLGCRAVLVVT